ncbi:MAG: alpha/beta hydrolase [Promethearchaeota archaeon]
MVGKTQKFFIENNDIKLEAEYYQNKPNDNTSAVIIFHPHPQYGGDMWNNVVSGIFNKFVKKDISCLRFNFRAVGRSTGNHTNGEGERRDAKACIDFLINDKKLKKLLICGYSYGAAIGCSMVNYSDKIIGYVAIAFPWDFMGTDTKESSQTNKSKLFIQGTRDFIANYNNFNRHYEFYKEPKKKEIINGADHFFRGYEERISNIVYDFFNSLMNNLN